MKRIFCMAASMLVLSSGMALAAHGKAGLWNISTTMNMALAMPPDVLEKMKAAGVSMPAAQTMTNQICMTQADVDSDKPPSMGKNDQGCDTHVTSQTGSSMAADMVCNGQMKGTGHMEVSYTGAEHYSGNYSFKGSVQGHPTGMSSTFQGNWVKADCGSVKPYSAAK